MSKHPVPFVLSFKFYIIAALEERDMVIFTVLELIELFNCFYPFKLLLFEPHLLLYGHVAFETFLWSFWNLGDLNCFYICFRWNLP